MIDNIMKYAKTGSSCSSADFKALIDTQLDCYQDTYTEVCGIPYDAGWLAQLGNFTACVAGAIPGMSGHCCMPWNAFKSVMLTTYQGLYAYTKATNVGESIKVGFNCGDGEYKPWSKDGGGVFVVMITVTLLALAVGSWAILTGQCRSWQPEGLSINADDIVIPIVGSPANEETYEDEEGTSTAAMIAHSPTTPAETLKQAEAAVAKAKAEIKKADSMTWLKAFDPKRNLASLFEVSPTRTIGGLDCMKAISMFWIVLAHAALLSNVEGMSDPSLLKSWTFKSGKGGFSNMFTMAAHLAVDTFFLVGGLLMGCVHCLPRSFDFPLYSSPTAAYEASYVCSSNRKSPIFVYTHLITFKTLCKVTLRLVSFDQKTAQSG